MLRSVGAYLVLLAAWLIFLASSLLVVRWVFPPDTRPKQSPVKIDLTTKLERPSPIERLLPPLPGADRLMR